MSHDKEKDYNEDTVGTGTSYNQNEEETPSKEIIKKDDSEIADEDKGRDKFSPGEADDYNPDEFATD